MRSAWAFVVGVVGVVVLVCGAFLVLRRIGREPRVPTNDRGCDKNPW